MTWINVLQAISLPSAKRRSAVPAVGSAMTASSARDCSQAIGTAWHFSNHEVSMWSSGIKRHQVPWAVAAAWFISALLMTSVSADSLWDHNGSVMRLKEQGKQIELFYEVPRSAMVEQGVRPGQLFFNGQRHGSKVVGIARAFLRKCAAPMEYAIQGNMVANNTIILKGRRPVFKDCRPQRTLKDDELVFVFLSGGTEAQAATNGSAPPAADASETPSASSTGLTWIDELLDSHRPQQ